MTLAGLLRKTALATATTALLITACGAGDDNDTTATPLTAFTSPVDGKTYCAWMENPHECPGPPGPPAAPFAMPSTEPHHDTGMTTTDLLLLTALFSYHTTYAPYYGGPGYYSHHIGPAWAGHPGTYYSGPGRPTTHTTNVTVYTDSARQFGRTYSSKIGADAKTATYKTQNGKTFTGDKAPATAFTGTNVRVSKPAGDAPVNRNGGQGSTPRTGSTSPTHSGGGKK